jgi:DNA repair protein RecN (Recombination protein N)
VIKELLIENFILIESKKIVFTEGLNVLTGETGHGKSILLKAIMLLFQGNISKKYIRNNNQESLVEGIVLLPKKHNIPKNILTKYSISKEVIISRVFSSKKSNIKINKIDATLQELEELGSYLCQALTQFQKFELLKDDAQLYFIDSLTSNKKNYLEFSENFKKYDVLTKELFLLNKEKKELDFVIDYKREEHERLTNLGISSSDLEIENKISRLENFEEEQNSLSNLLNLMNDEDSGLNEVFNEFKKSSLRSETSEELKPDLNKIKDCLISIENILIKETSNLESSQESLEEILLRYNEIKPHLKKYNNSIESLLNHIKKLENVITRYDEIITSIDLLDIKIKNEKKSLILIADKVRADRIKVSKDLEKNVLKEFSSLKLDDCELSIEFNKTELSSTGMDHIKFLIKTNKGGNFYPLEDVISGGELSRIMFTLVNIQDNVGKILCFDEIDAGVGGKTIIQLSKKLKAISVKNQIICITHSPSIAVIANNHIYVSKQNKGNSTVTNFNSLNNELILKEISRMLGYDSNKEGLDITEQLIKELVHQIER